MRAVEAKAVRLVAEEKVRIVAANDEVRAQVMGDTGIYEVLWSPDPETCMCQCKANREGHRRCSHLIAVELHQLAKEQQ